MINLNCKSHAFDIAKSTAIQLSAGTLFSKIYFPVVVKEGIAYSTLLGVTTSLVEKITFHATSVEEFLENKALVLAATLAVMYFATTRLIAGPLLGRVSLEFSADKVLKLCVCRFVTHMGYAIYATLEAKSHLMNVDEESEQKSTVLHGAALIGLDVEGFLKNGANVDEKDENGSTALHIAAYQGYEKIVESLLRGGVKVDEKNADGLTALHLGAKFVAKKVVESLLKGGANVDEKDEEGLTALHWAIRSDCLEGSRKVIEVIESLLRGGAKVDEKDAKGLTALHWAVKCQEKKLVEALLKNGAKINEKDGEGFTPLHLAARFGYVELVESLLGGGAKVDMQDHCNKTPLQLAEENEHHVAVKILQDATPKSGWFSWVPFTKGLEVEAELNGETL